MYKFNNYKCLLNKNKKGKKKVKSYLLEMNFSRMMHILEIMHAVCFGSIQSFGHIIIIVRDGYTDGCYYLENNVLLLCGHLSIG